jgi:hypothetical protein
MTLEEVSLLDDSFSTPTFLGLDLQGIMSSIYAARPLVSLRARDRENVGF